MKKYFNIFLLAGAILFLLQLSITPFIHNHPQDLQEHYDCPAYILNISLISFMFIIIISINLKIPYLRRIQTSTNHRNISKNTLFGFHNKAPPIK